MESSPLEFAAFMAFLLYQIFLVEQIKLSAFSIYAQVLWVLPN
jgi:hypothetical protein